MVNHVLMERVVSRYIDGTIISAVFGGFVGILGLVGLPATAGDDLPLVFAWPAGLEANVKMRIKGVKNQASEQLNWNFQASYLLKTSLRGKSLVVDRLNFSGWQGLDPKVGLAAGQGLLSTMIPRLVVSGAGYLEQIENTEEVKTQYQALLNPGESMSSLEKDQLESATTPEGLRAIAVDDWNVMVGFWSKKTIGVGKTIETRNKVSLPQLGGGMVELIKQASNQGAIQCQEQDKEKRCVKLILRSSANKEDVLALIKKRFANMPKDTRMQDLEQTNEIEVITDPRNLLPYRVTIKTEHKMIYAQEVSRLTNERSFWFEYLKVPPANF